ncbi:CgeB family protein [Roseburia hominis]
MYRWKAYNYRDIEQTFLLLGHTVDNIEQELGSYDVSPGFERVIEEKIRGTHYDMVFTVNYFPLISNVCERTGVKYVSWTCDNPLISMYHESVFHDCNYIFTFDKTNYLEFRGMGVKHIWYLPLAVDTERMDALLGAPEEIGTAESVPAEIGKAGRRKAAQDPEMQKYRGDVAFVGSLYERNSYDKIKNRLPEYLRGYFDAVMEAQLNISGANIVEPMLTTNILEQLQEYFQLEKSDGSFSDLGLIFQTTVLGFKIAEIERRRALIELSKHYKVNVYSNSDVSDLLRIQYCGSVDYWSEMPKVFRMSKINLNFTIPNIKSGIPLRIWDVLGCGGFLLTNYQAEIPYYFKEGEDLVCFDGLEDLCEKVGYYLEHEEERKRIAGNGYRKVREKHSYIERIHTILDTVACEGAK